MSLVSLSPFRYRAYARLWTGAFVSNIGTWMQMLAIGIYVTDVTDQAAWTGAVFAAGFVPIAVLAPVGGALADRLPRRRLLIVTELVQVALAGFMTILFIAGDPSPAVLTVIVFADGIAAALGFPAFQAMLPDLVPEEELSGAISLSSAQYNLGRVVGPVIAGVVINFGGYAWALGINAASFLAVVAVLLTIELPAPTPRKEGESLRSAIAEGVRFVRNDPGLRIGFAAMCLNTLIAAPFIALVPVMAQKVLDAGSQGTSVLVTAQGIGAVAAALMLGTLTKRFGIRRVVMGAMSALPFALVAYAAAPNLAISAVTLLFVGGLYLGALSSFFTISQLRAPPELRGRVLAVNNVVLGSLYPLGAVIQGRVADAIGLRATTAGAAILMGAVLLVVRIARPGITRAVDPTVVPPPAVATMPPTSAEPPIT